MNTNGFNENNITYDENGNIMSLKRNTSTIGGTAYTEVDNLTYTYDSANPNRLLTVTDGSGTNYTGFGFRNITGSTASYGYDGNGNLVTDPYKALSIAYNYLNKTDKITATNATGRYVDYSYGASGAVLRKRSYENNVLQNTTDYVDGFVYVNNTLSYFSMPEGRVVNTGSALSPEYVIKDNQGNARFSFKNNGSDGVQILQENSYYAFGKVMPGSPVAIPTNSNKNLYNGGSEWQNIYDNLPDYYETYYRNYDPAIGRFISVDPKADASGEMTSYNYAGNNPVMLNDPMGDIFHETDQQAIDRYLNIGMGNYSASDLEWAAAYYGGSSFSMTSDPGVISAVISHINGNENSNSGTRYLFNPDGSFLMKQNNTQSYKDEFEILAQVNGQGSYDWKQLDSFTGIAYLEASGNKYEGGMTLDQYLGLLGVTTSSVEQGAGIARVGSNLQLYRATARGGVFMGNQFVTTVGLAKVAHMAGVAGAIISTGVDLYNYADNDPNTPGSKVIENGAFTVIGLAGGVPGAIISGGYFLLQGYYPGGANQAVSDFSTDFGQHAQSWGQIKMEQGGL